MPKGKVLVVDSDRHAREVLTRSLIAGGYEAVSAASGMEAVDKAHLENPSAIVVAMQMSGMDGIETCRELRKTIFAPIVLIGDCSKDTDIVAGLSAGADYCVTNPIRIPVLLAYVDAAVRRGTIYSQRQAESSKLQIKDLLLDLNAHELNRNGKAIPLSPTEFRLFATLARNAGRTLTRDQLLQSVWETQDADGVYSRTVDVHVGRIRRKIGDDASRQLYITTVRGIGYKMLA